MNRSYRFTGIAVAAVTLAASAAAFSDQQAAARPTARQAAAGPAIASPAPHPMIPAALPAGPAGISAVANIRTVGSKNWAGYAVGRNEEEKFRRVIATFFVPFLNCAVSPGTDGTYSSHWVGLDGYTSGTVEQDGIEADCAGTTAQYFAWREVFPRPERASTIAIHPGDSVTASVRFIRASGEYRMEVKDNTDGRYFTVYQTCDGSACQRNSAEVISEAPTLVQSGTNVQSSLADYGALGFSGISITNGSGRIGGIRSSYWDRVKIEQVGYVSHAVIARPTVLNGSSFDNYWLGES